MHHSLSNRVEYLMKSNQWCSQWRRNLFVINPNSIVYHCVDCYWYTDYNRCLNSLIFFSLTTSHHWYWIFCWWPSLAMILDSYLLCYDIIYKIWWKQMASLVNDMVKHNLNFRLTYLFRLLSLSLSLSHYIWWCRCSLEKKNLCLILTVVLLYFIDDIVCMINWIAVEHTSIP
jgi:hypothetical protein